LRDVRIRSLILSGLSGEKSETLVRYTKQNHTLTVRKKGNTKSHSLSPNMVLVDVFFGPNKEE
jgi:hypothetical protein